MFKLLYAEAFFFFLAERLSLYFSDNLHIHCTEYCINVSTWQDKFLVTDVTYKRHLWHVPVTG